MRYIVLLGHIFTDRDWDRLGCAFFAARGYDVVPVECIDLVSPDLRAVMSHGDYRSVAGAVSLSREEDAEKFMSDLNADDLVLSTLTVTPCYAPIYRLLKKYNVDYAAITLGKVPSRRFARFSAARSFGEFIAYKISDLKSIVYHLKNKLVALRDPSIQWGDLAPARWWLDAGNDNSMFDLYPPKKNLSERVPVHSLDLQIAKDLEHAPSALDKKASPDKKVRAGYAVFLDSGFFGSTDFEYHGLTNDVSAENYGLKLKALFDHVQNRFGLDVVVALHPKSQPDLVRRYLGSLETVQGKACELVRGSQLVLSHGTTAVTYAVHYRKPIVFLTSDDIERSTIDAPIMVRMSSWLGLRRVNIDNADEIAKVTIPSVDGGQYAVYEDRFVCEKHINVRSIWEELALRFEVSRNVKPGVSELQTA